MEWAQTTAASFCNTARWFITQDVLPKTIDPFFIELLTVQKVKVDCESEEYLNTYICDEHMKAEAATNADTLIFYNDTLSNLKAKALECAECKVAEYKSNLKVAAKECKLALLLDFEKCAPKPSTLAKAAACKACCNYTDPTASPSPALSISCSYSHSYVPSPELHVLSQSLDMQMPHASPLVELLPTCALTEPALELQPPLTNVSVGPPSNSFKMAIMHVDTSTMQTFEYPAPELSALPTNVTQNNSSQLSFNPLTSAIKTLIHRLSLQLSSITSCLDQLKHPKTYSPSIYASLWAPPHTFCPKPGQLEYSAQDKPTKEDLEPEDLDALPLSWILLETISMTCPNKFPSQTNLIGQMPTSPLFTILISALLTTKI